MQSIVEVVCVGAGSSKTYNSVYTDPSFCKMVIVQDDDKFPSPRLCLLRKWPNFDGGFGFNLYEDLISSTGSLKVEDVVKHSPAEAGGLRKNDVIIEINNENIEYKSFFRLVEILKEACSQNEMELLVLAEDDAEWYRVRNISVNTMFPNIEYCETPYYGHILKPLESPSQNNMNQKSGNSQIEFHSSSGKLYRTTLVVDKDKDSIYRRIEELPSTGAQSNQVGTVPPLRPEDSGSVRIYYRRDKDFQAKKAKRDTSAADAEDQTVSDSGHGTLSTKPSTQKVTSPFSTFGKTYGEQANVDLLRDEWADLMDKYLNNKFRSNEKEDQQTPQRDSSAKRNYTIRLDGSSAATKRAQSPSDASFSFLYSGRDDFHSASATSFRELNRQTSPYQHLLQKGNQQTQNRFPSPHHSKYSPTRSQPRPGRPQVESPTSKSYFIRFLKGQLKSRVSVQLTGENESWGFSRFK